VKSKRAIPVQVQPVVSLPYDIFMSLLVAVMLSNDEHCRKAWRTSIPFLPEEIKDHLRKKNIELKNMIDSISKS